MYWCIVHFLSQIHEIMAVTAILFLSSGWEDISSTQGNIWPPFQTRPSSLKNYAARRIFKCLLVVRSDVVKHGLLVLGMFTSNAGKRFIDAFSFTISFRFSLPLIGRKIYLCSNWVGHPARILYNYQITEFSNKALKKQNDMVTFEFCYSLRSKQFQYEAVFRILLCG